MPTNEKAKVEKYLLTPKAKATSQQIKRVMQAGRIIKAGLVSEAAKLQQLQGVYGQYQQMLQKLTQSMPARKTNEIGQQPDMGTDDFDGVEVSY